MLYSVKVDLEPGYIDYDLLLISRTDKVHMKDHQLVNKIYNLDYYCQKITLSRMYDSFKKHGSAYDFYPMGHNSNSSLSVYDQEKLYIYKPTHGFGGEGITLHSYDQIEVKRGAIY